MKVCIQYLDNGNYIVINYENTLMFSKKREAWIHKNKHLPKDFEQTELLFSYNETQDYSHRFGWIIGKSRNEEVREECDKMFRSLGTRKFSGAGEPGWYY